MDTRFVCFYRFDLHHIVPLGGSSLFIGALGCTNRSGSV